MALQIGGRDAKSGAESLSVLLANVLPLTHPAPVKPIHHASPPRWAGVVGCTTSSFTRIHGAPYLQIQNQDLPQTSPSYVPSSHVLDLNVGSHLESLIKKKFRTLSICYGEHRGECRPQSGYLPAQYG